jgi:hypothetical protein
MDAFNINPINTRLQWSSVSNNRIAMIEHSTKKFLSGDNIDSISNDVLFSSLISCYANFYNAFKSQGNRLSANACYIEWKNIETRYLEYQYKSGKNKAIFFNYVMNGFLRTFCDYGTNPLKAIQIAFYVLLFFAGIYFFFPYSIVSFHRRSLFDQLKVYGHYLSSPQSLFAADSKGKVPWYFHIFGKPVYWLERLKERPSKWFYRLIDLFPDEWEKLSPLKKLLANVLYGIVFFLTVIWFLVIHILDSVTLSLNVFSTLGFGQIPIKGIPRYLAILEGFIGWFLLSIFSVSLISQVIQ